ncbi:MAG: hypothetical protein Q8O57_04870, partial [Kiritimatiellota bacterium]|nr:hypothetical protein [Kiritimatiellota bacterium]
MNRLTDFFLSFCLALFLHGLLVLGAVWFWALRSPELRPVFQGGDVSLAVTFVAEAEAREAWSVKRGAVEEPVPTVVKSSPDKIADKSEGQVREHAPD